jgi:hypothetical protein
MWKPAVKPSARMVQSNQECSKYARASITDSDQSSIDTDDADLSECFDYPYLNDFVARHHSYEFEDLHHLNGHVVPPRPLFGKLSSEIPISEVRSIPEHETKYPMKYILFDKKEDEKEKIIESFS